MLYRLSIVAQQGDISGILLVGNIVPREELKYAVYWTRQDIMRGILQDKVKNRQGSLVVLQWKRRKFAMVPKIMWDVTPQLFEDRHALL